MARKKNTTKTTEVTQTSEVVEKTTTVTEGDKEIAKEEVVENKLPLPTFPPENSEENIENIETEPVIKKDEEIIPPPSEIIEKSVEVAPVVEKVTIKKHDENILINISIIRNERLSYKGYMKISDVISKLKKFPDSTISVTSEAIADILKKSLTSDESKRIIVKKK